MTQPPGRRSWSGALALSTDITNRSESSERSDLLRRVTGNLGTGTHFSGNRANQDLAYGRALLHSAPDPGWTFGNWSSGDATACAPRTVMLRVVFIWLGLSKAAERIWKQARFGVEDGI